MCVSIGIAGGSWTVFFFSIAFMLQSKFKRQFDSMENRFLFIINRELVIGFFGGNLLENVYRFSFSFPNMRLKCWERHWSTGSLSENSKWNNTNHQIINPFSICSGPLWIRNYILYLRVYVYNVLQLSHKYTLRFH